MSASFARSLPLFIASGLFFVFGVVVYLFDPHYGPGAFTLWSLLLVLGFVAAIGGVASWLLVAEPDAGEAPRGRGHRAEEDTGPEPARAPRPSATLDRADFGRPAPAVRDRGERPHYRPAEHELAGRAERPEIWDERDATEEVPESDIGAPVVRPEPTDGPGYASATDALKDLDGIEQELVPRSSRTRRDSSPA